MSTDTRVGPSETFEEVIDRRYGRRAFVKGALSAAPLLAITPDLLLARRAQVGPTDKLSFSPVSLSSATEVEVAPGYRVQKFLRWGEPILPGAPAFDFNAQSAAAQLAQFGYNCDCLQYFALPQHGSQNSNRGLLAVNHEYTNPELMFPGFVPGGAAPAVTTGANVAIELAAHGLSIVEVELDRRRNQWNLVRGAHNRRVTGETEIVLTGPALGDPRLATSYDPSGTRVRGMLNNCGGGTTPWGSVLTCEENFNQYFANRAGLADTDERKTNHTRYGVGSNVSGLPADRSERGWELYYDRFDLTKDPNEPFRFGWVVEIDPYDPHFIPKKRTALGRLKHEAATAAVAPDDRVTVYTGDDERFEYMYKFVTAGKYDSNNRAANFNLLDDGTLYVAKFNDDGTGQWLPLVYGQETLVAPHFTSQAEVLINTRFAADAVGGTKMDRPEDIETNPVNGKLYCVMTNNTNRGTGSNPAVNGANPRTGNRHGHIIELTEDGNDPTSLAFTWEIFLLCGNPGTQPVDSPTPTQPAEAAYFGGFDHSKVSPISCPDNITFDRKGNLWIATDGQPTTFGMNDGVFAVPVEGEQRGFLRQFLSGIPGGEVASLHFGALDQALFVTIQHPGEPGTGPDSANSTFENPTSVWPDGNTPPRPSVVVATKKTGNGSPLIGS